MIVSIDKLSVVREATNHHRVGFTNGCFDILHAGHVAFLQECQLNCEVMFIAVNSDESARRLKGAGRPLVPMRHRIVLLEVLGLADFIVLMDEDDPRALLKVVWPDVFFKSDEYQNPELAMVEQELLEQMGTDVQFIKSRYQAHTSEFLARYTDELTQYLTE